MVWALARWLVDASVLSRVYLYVLNLHTKWLVQYAKLKLFFATCFVLVWILFSKLHLYIINTMLLSYIHTVYLLYTYTYTYALLCNDWHNSHKSWDGQSFRFSKFIGVISDNTGLINSVSGSGAVCRGLVLSAGASVDSLCWCLSAWAEWSGVEGSGLRLLSPASPCLEPGHKLLRRLVLKVGADVAGVCAFSMASCWATAIVWR